MTSTNNPALHNISISISALLYLLFIHVKFFFVLCMPASTSNVLRTIKDLKTVRFVGGSNNAPNFKNFHFEMEAKKNSIAMMTANVWITRKPVLIITSVILQLAAYFIKLVKWLDISKWGKLVGLLMEYKIESVRITWYLKASLYDLLFFRWICWHRKKIYVLGLASFALFEFYFGFLTEQVRLKII